MEYRLLLNSGEFCHCIWIDNSQRPLGRHSPVGQAEVSGLLGVNYRGGLVVAPDVQDWLNCSVGSANYKLNGHVRTGMAVLFLRKSDAMLFKLAHSGG